MITSLHRSATITQKNNEYAGTTHEIIQTLRDHHYYLYVTISDGRFISRVVDAYGRKIAIASRPSIEEAVSTVVQRIP